MSCPIYNARPINRESIRTRRGQILHRDFARDARRIARPIAHRGFAGEKRPFLGGRGSNGICDIETDCGDRDAEAQMNELALYHAFGIASRTRCAWIGVARASRALVSASRRNDLSLVPSEGFRLRTRVCRKSFAIARTRSPAREPRALPRTCTAAVRRSGIAALVFF